MTSALTRIGWIRHGVTEWNRQGKIQGVTDIPLSLEGTRQARKLADRLEREQGGWQGIACSDLARASKTAEIIAERLGIPVVRDSRLRERSFGEAEGTTHEERIARWGQDWRRLVPDQESDERVTARGLSFLEEFVKRHPGEAWLVVTHGSFLARMLHALCRDLEDAHLLNVSLTVMEKRGDGWVSLLHNCTAHLNDDTP
ncbi:histidine phosphatase family protein [Cohnella sp. CFH 77786]|uniref:histidine phosphatase family protein n=1 Tax=Cohnella sp. CFH 77786 TaxID=2662265 RepID=UPI001C60AF81|nr:histidine phosphatase family protein [Cohnella sp. CFH 77786]MBW5446621.1 histidine phosphatase family protein [Cohnella sp. CFH 77786]